MLKANPRSCVPRLDFRTSAGFLDGGTARERSGARGGGPCSVITDFGILTPHAETRELQLSSLFPGATVGEAQAAVGWPLMPAPRVEALPAPSADELVALRALHSRTRAAHSRAVHLPA